MAQVAHRPARHSALIMRIREGRNRSVSRERNEREKLCPIECLSGLRTSRVYHPEWRCGGGQRPGSGSGWLRFCMGIDPVATQRSHPAPVRGPGPGSRKPGFASHTHPPRLRRGRAGPGPWKPRPSGWPPAKLVDSGTLCRPPASSEAPQSSPDLLFQSGQPASPQASEWPSSGSGCRLPGRGPWSGGFVGWAVRARGFDGG